MGYAVRWMPLSYMCDDPSMYLSQHLSSTLPRDFECPNQMYNGLDPNPYMEHAYTELPSSVPPGLAGAPGHHRCALC